MQASLEQFKKSIREQRDRIEDRFVRDLREIASLAFKTAVGFSPVDTGSYVTSHRIGIGHIDPSFTLHFTPGANMSAMKAEALSRELSKIEAINKVSVIYLSNRVPHAINVEFTGWWTDNGFVPPYMVYNATRQILRAYIHSKKSMSR